MNEELILQRVAAGSHDAFTLLYQKYHGVLIKYLGYLGCRDKHLQQDITQEIFLVLWAKRTRWVSISNFDNYLYIMARNHLSDIKRKAKIQGLRMPDFLHEEAVDNSTMEEICFRETRQIYSAGINILPPRTRKAFLLREEYSLKTNQIAKIMHISPKTVKNHRQTAIKKLRAWLKEHIN